MGRGDSCIQERRARKARRCCEVARESVCWSSPRDKVKLVRISNGFLKWTAGIGGGERGRGRGARREARAGCVRLDAVVVLLSVWW